MNGDKLTPEEWGEYINLLTRFHRAKLEKNYSESDALRKEIIETWDSNFNEHEVAEMVQSGHYIFHPFFESVNHRLQRVAKR